MILPVSIMLIHLDGWFGYRPLKVGESAIFSVKLSEEGGKLFRDISVSADKGLAVETPPLRISESGEIDWRIRAIAVGEHIIAVDASGHKIRKNVKVFQSKLTRLSRFMVGSTFRDILLNPGEGPIEKSSYIRKIGVGYPSREIEIFGWRSHWLWPFFVLSIAGALLFRRFLRTEI
jgi:hypothetical protein